MAMDRRSLMKSALLVLAGGPLGLKNPWPISVAQAREPSGSWRHGLSKLSDLKYPAAFKHFDYVNPNAPKGGAASQIALGGFDNFNLVVGGAKGSLAGGIELLYDTLMVPALDEVASMYGLLAEAVSHPDDFSSVTYRLRSNAKWHDGKPVTPEDVIFSFDAFKKLSPQAAASYRQVTKAEKTGEREVTFRFDGSGNQELPQVVGQLTVLPKHWWEGSDSEGRKRSIADTTLEPPLGSGPYRIKEFSPGRNITYERVKNYWGQSLNVNVGRDNFDNLRYEYFRDATIAIEAFKGDLVDWRTENSAKNWATAYDFAAVTDKRVILEEFPINSIGLMQAFAFNLRREKFKDPRVRLAFNYAFDFEEMNKKIFFGQYTRTSSYFEGIAELSATGLPQGRELQLLESVRDKVPAQVFTTPFSNPVGGNPTAVRNNLREALRLFKESGYEIRNQQIINTKNGGPFEVELLTNAPLFERVYLFYKPSLERLGITVSVRTVDQAQYENRLRNWDFDIITFAWGQSLLPGNEQRGYWGSAAADQVGSDNVIGIKNPAVDAIIEKVIYAKTRDELVAAARALDRVLLWNHYVVPQWSYAKLRTARWNRFGRPETMPKYGMAAFPALWWWDAERAAKTGGKR
ncbi:MAG TPA: extracellular solute-binding protein [Pseudolabrys sp.]|jgi:microcin C transport system substrate-binding protein